MKKLVWFRTDLRLHDNQTLSAALVEGDGPVAYVYVHEPHAAGDFRKKFLAESVIDLRAQLIDRGAELICLEGRPVELLPQLCSELAITDVFYARLSAFNERRAESELDRCLTGANIRVHRFQTHTLLCDEDAGDFDPYRPMSFSKLRKFIEKRGWPVRTPLTIPARFAPALRTNRAAWDPGDLSNPEDLPHGFHCEGGEREAIANLESFFMANYLSTYKQTRNGLLEWTDSSKFSPALSLGCLSPRRLYREVREFEETHGVNVSTTWFLYELLWRDHFHFLARVRGADLFTDPGCPAKPRLQSEAEAEALNAWKEGRTGVAFIDAAMNELRLSGWLSNRMRQNAASFLVHNLGVNWHRGAGWFEECLIDYDPASNWGNWAYIAGAGFDHKPHAFNIEQQAAMYDADGAYVRRWITA